MKKGKEELEEGGRVEVEEVQELGRIFWETGRLIEGAEQGETRGERYVDCLFTTGKEGVQEREGGWGVCFTVKGSVKGTGGGEESGEVRG